MGEGAEQLMVGELRVERKEEGGGSDLASLVGFAQLKLKGRKARAGKAVPEE